MFKYLRKKKGQSTLEYAILIIIVIGALLSIQVYIKRGIQGRMKSATDDIGDQYKVGGTNWIKKTSTSSNVKDSFTAGVMAKSQNKPEVTGTNVYSNILNVDQDYWGK